MNITIDDVINRNIALDALEESRNRLFLARKKLDDMAIDTCHDVYYNYIKEQYTGVINKITELATSIEEGDWCYNDDHLEELTANW